LIENQAADTFVQPRFSYYKQSLGRAIIRGLKQKERFSKALHKSFHMASNR
jgi:hypothetical protein